MNKLGLVTASWLATISIGFPLAMQPVFSSPLTVKECQEDMPCWDCETMGNMVCGPDIQQSNGKV